MNTQTKQGRRGQRVAFDSRDAAAAEQPEAEGALYVYSFCIYILYGYKTCVCV